LSDRSPLARVLLSSPGASYAAHKTAIDEALARVLASGQYILGAEVARFEEQFAGFAGAAKCVAVANGTDAIELALRACGVGHGDVVATVSHTAVASVSAICLAGATPLLVDIEPKTLTMDPAALRAAIEDHPDRGSIKAILPVHLYGAIADMPSILAVAEDFGLRVIEDCSQAHGAALHGRRAGTWGDMGTFSFYPTKNLGALGDGGAVITSNADFAERVRQLREYGWRVRNTSERLGRNSRLDELQAAILQVKLSVLAGETERRRANAGLYLRDLGGADLILPIEPAGSVHVFHQFVIRTKMRQRLMTALEERGIQSAVHYPVPVHRQAPFRGREARPLGCTDESCKEILSIPVHPYLAHEDLAMVCDVVRGVCGKRG
jgi:dTDP-4-amino-4,6-dideoxygalactose transaminase